MTTGTVRLVASGILTLALCVAAPAPAADTEPGVWWEHTAEMSMPGMSMPATTQKVCAPKNGMTEPPGADERCKMTDVKHVGAKMTWKVECTGPRMTGEGELTQGKDSYNGSMTMHSAQGDMTMKMRGKLLGGDCDAGATRKQVAAIKQQQEDQTKQIEEMQAQGCDQAIEEVELRLFTGPAAPCKKPDQVARVCARMSTRQGYLAFQEKASDPQMKRIAGELCKSDPEALRAKLCTQAAAEVQDGSTTAAAPRKKAKSGSATSQDPLDFMAANCPDETRLYAKKICAGRSFTGMPENIRPICVQYAREELSKGGGKDKPAPDESASGDQPKNPKDQAQDQAKKLLKGLFGK